VIASATNAAGACWPGPGVDAIALLLNEKPKIGEHKIVRDLIGRRGQNEDTRW
jgi:hypothetical protein